MKQQDCSTIQNVKSTQNNLMWHFFVMLLIHYFPSQVFLCRIQTFPRVQQSNLCSVWKIQDWLNARNFGDGAIAKSSLRNFRFKRNRWCNDCVYLNMPCRWWLQTSCNTKISNFRFLVEIVNIVCRNGKKKRDVLLYTFLIYKWSISNIKVHSHIWHNTYETVLLWVFKLLACYEDKSAC